MKEKIFISTIVAGILFSGCTSGVRDNKETQVKQGGSGNKQINTSTKTKVEDKAKTMSEKGNEILKDTKTKVEDKAKTMSEKGNESIKRY